MTRRLSQIGVWSAGLALIAQACWANHSTFPEATIQTALNSGFPVEVRIRAIQNFYVILRSDNQVTVLTALAKLARDPEYPVRAEAVSTLGALLLDRKSRLAVVIDALTTTLDRHKESYSGMRDVAAWALGQNRDDHPQVLHALNRALLGDPDHMVRVEAAQSLARIKSSDAAVVTALVQALNPKLEKAGEVRSAAAHALGNVGKPYPDVLAALAKALHEDPYGGVRRSAAWALKNLRDPQGSYLLENALGKEKNQEIKSTLERAFRELENYLQTDRAK